MQNLRFGPWFPWSILAMTSMIAAEKGGVCAIFRELNDFLRQKAVTAGPLWSSMSQNDWERKRASVSLVSSFLFAPILFSIFHAPHPPSSDYFRPLPRLRIMHLTNHWARKGINGYSKQRAIMGTLVLRKLSIFGPARRRSGITGESAPRLPAKAGCVGADWKRRGGVLWVYWGGVCSLDTRRRGRGSASNRESTKA